MLLSCAGDAAARRLPGRTTTARRAHVTATCPRPSNRRRAQAPLRRRVLHLRRARRARMLHSVVAAPTGVVSQSMLRPTGTAADLNPMPQLLDLDDRSRDMRTSTRMLHHLAAPH